MFLKKYKNLRQMKPFYAKYIKQIIFLIGVMVIASSAGILIAYLLSEQLLAITNQNIGLMIKFTILIITAVLVHHVCWFFWSKFAAIIASKVAADIKNLIIKNTLSSKISTIKKHSTGYYLERLSQDAEEVGKFLPNVAGTMVDVLTNCSFLVLIYFFNWQCGLFFSFGIFLLFIIDFIKIKKDLKNFEKIKITSEAANSKFNECIRGIYDIKSFGIAQETANANLHINEKLCNQNIARTTTFEFFERLKTFTQWIIDACLVLLCAFWLFPTGQITVVVLLIIFNYKSLMYDTVGFFSKVKSFYMQGDFQSGRILEIFDKSQQENFGQIKILPECCDIEVKNLNFSYYEKSLLNNISFKIFRHTATVLLGASGSGKTTLFYLLSRLYDAPPLSIFYGGIDILDFSEETLRKMVCVVNQEQFIFNDTILNNLKIANKESTESQVKEACKMANIYNEILQMENGFNTLLNENGDNLSGGQKQRIAIARAILKNTPIMLFDEPTSALDNKNQRYFYNTIKQLKQTKTIFVIAHKITDEEVSEIFDNVLNISNGSLL